MEFFIKRRFYCRRLFFYLSAKASDRRRFPTFSAVVKGPYLQASLKNSHADSSAVAGVSKGDNGLVVTALRPSGRISIGDRVFDVVTEGDFIEKDAPVEVISRSKITVSRKKHE